MELNPASKQVLRLLMDSKVVQGAALLKMFDGDAVKAVDAIRPLIDEGLVQTNSLGLNPSTLLEAGFNLNFSAMRKAAMLAS